MIYDEDFSSKKVFELRKEKKLGEAYSLALKLYDTDSNDEWTQKAYAWVLIDVIKNEINNNNLNKANQFFNKLNSLNFVNNDEIITKQIQYIQPKLNSDFQDILKADNLSKNRNHRESIALFRQLYKTEKLSNKDLDSYGWSLYRCLKDTHDKLSLDEVKQYLFEYLNLKNERPSLVHSFILQFAVVYANGKKDFDLYKFFQIWDPKSLRDEDFNDQFKDEKTYPSLLKRLIRVFVDSNTNIDLNYLASSIKYDHLAVESFKEAYFWKLFNLHKNDNFYELWKEFDFYATNYSNFGPSLWHSEILKIANRFMTEDNSWRFFGFFTKWNYKNFRNEDWKEEHNGDNTYKPLALNALSAVNDFLKNKEDFDFKSLEWLEEFYELAIKNIGQDKWLLRNYAILLNKLDKRENAIQIYKDIIFDLIDQSYIWHEFSSLLKTKDIDLAISMLCKAISIQKNQDFLGQIHLDLADLLIENNKLSEAKTELLKYEKQRTDKGWKLSDKYSKLCIILQDITENENNEEFYNSNLEKAEDYIYRDIEWTDLILYDQFNNKDGKKRLLFSDFNDIELMVNPFKFDILRNAKINEVFKFKLYYDQTNHKFLVLKVDKSNILKEEMIVNALSDIAIVDHINNRKQLFHYVVDRNNDGIVKFDQTQIRPEIGQFIEIKYFKTFNKKENKYKLNILNVLETYEIKSSLIKESTGDVRLNIDRNGNKFGFVGDYFISPYLVSKYKLIEDDFIGVKVLFNGEKWNVYDIDRL